MTLATIKWFDVQKGFGFAVTTNGQEVFVHRNYLTPGQSINSLMEGSTIECDVHDGFDEALNSGRLRDVDMNHRNPRSSNFKGPAPKAFRVRAVKSCGR